MKYLITAFLALAISTPAAAQIRIVGRVIDDITEAPIAKVQLALWAPDGSTLSRTETSDMGTFEFVVHRVRAVRINARRISYTTSTTPLLYFDNRNFFQVEVRLDPEAILLAPLEVLAWSELKENPLLEGYQRRLETGLGSFITREEVEARNPRSVTDLLREVPGLQVTGSGPGFRPVVELARSQGRNCVTQIFVDGFLMNRRMVTPEGVSTTDFRIDDTVIPASVEGIEIYRGASTVPAEFLSPDAACGVIAIWTRRGGARR